MSKSSPIPNQVGWNEIIRPTDSCQCPSGWPADTYATWRVHGSKSIMKWWQSRTPFDAKKGQSVRPTLLELEPEPEKSKTLRVNQSNLAINFHRPRPHIGYREWDNTKRRGNLKTIRIYGVFFLVGSRKRKRKKKPIDSTCSVNVCNARSFSSWLWSAPMSWTKNGKEKKGRTWSTWWNVQQSPTHGHDRMAFRPATILFVFIPLPRHVTFGWRMRTVIQQDWGLGWEMERDNCHEPDGPTSQQSLYRTIRVRPAQSRQQWKWQQTATTTTNIATQIDMVHPNTQAVSFYG